MIWYAVAGAVVLAAAALLIWIWLEARGIRGQALRALAAAEQVRENTRPLWALPDVSFLLQETLGTVGSIAARAETIADVVAPREPGEVRE